jgi:hypothetical protein
MNFTARFFMSDNPTSEGLFDLSDQLLDWMRHIGATMHDAVRALRPGGPLDNANYLTQCRKCGVEKAETIRWFGDREFTCECGGKFDVRGLNAFHFFVTRTLSLVREGAPASAVAREKQKADLLYHKFFRKHDVEY